MLLACVRGPSLVVALVLALTACSPRSTSSAQQPSPSALPTRNAVTQQGATARQPAGELFKFGLMGDQLYGASGEARYPTLAADIDGAPIAFVAFGGDFKNGSSPCDDTTFEDRLARFSASVHPFIFLPGDNEWSDCWRPQDGGYDPIERLDKLRATFAAGDESLGQTRLRLDRQSSMPGFERYRENVRWVVGNILFVGLNVQGSNNNRGRTAEQDAEFAERQTANLAWMRDAFGLARTNGNAGVVIIWQADPLILNTDPLYSNLPSQIRAALAVSGLGSGYTELIAALKTEVQTFGKPVVLAHGDSHYFRVDKPFRDSSGATMRNFTRVEWFGERDVGWVEATVDPSDPELFSFRPILLD